MKNSRRRNSLCLLRHTSLLSFYSKSDKESDAGNGNQRRHNIKRFYFDRFEHYYKAGNPFHKEVNIVIASLRSDP